MTVNPYIMQECEPRSASTSRHRAAKFGVGGKTNRTAMACAMVGVIVGVWKAGIPSLGGLSNYEFGRVMGHTLFHIHVCAAAGYLLGWIVRILFTRPVLALLIIGGVVATGGAFAVRRGQLSLDFIARSSSGLASIGSMPFTEKPIDFARHQEAGRWQLKDKAFSVILPPNWKQKERGSNFIIYTGSTGDAFPGSVALKVHPKPGRLTVETIQDSVVKSIPGFVGLVESGELEIDEKQAFFVACQVRLKGRNLREVVYIVPGKSSLYELTVCCDEPPTASSVNCLSRVFKSARVD